MIRIDVEKCKGCKLCVNVCPKKILGISGKLNISGLYPVECIDQSQCIACKSCGIMCPDGVMTVEKL
jgi:2-oxoglutarate ferredoxin oxidoreductase subunit delta